jgi:hypothetical protein
MNTNNNLPVAIPIAQPIDTFTPTGNTTTMSSAKKTTSDNILIVKLNMNTNGGSIGQNIRYSPDMSNLQVYKEYPDILFIPTIKLENDMFNKTVETMSQLGSFEKRKIFLSPALFSNFIATLQNKYKYEQITLEEAKKKGIINNNIQFILNIFFGKGNHLILSGITYTINNYKWNTGFEETRIPGKKIRKYSVNIDIQLIKGDNLSFIDFARSGCLSKKNDIINHYYKLIVKKKDDNNGKQTAGGNQNKNKIMTRKKSKRNKRMEKLHQIQINKTRSKK